ncbi:J domain-containing protein [Malacoplasma iowae]|uniref:DnaJ domain-containing protein n=2 Tax=Malacoplasma iowae 695 TaxID=1048830 RepID=A0A9J7BWJ2_MALIO|nr:DnaJ domain-containing protein [Malacoplasma iowae]VEU63361.1 molecular chaperone DnaJ [Mycoplasmopsis fermentans]EGZ31436.1 DnaJ-class molecular chaperone [Malacoplasma iowae 695]UYS84717.1 DnaJ domain-containing protein [Malacoplasma iowae 695]WPL35572.1 DnaJ domain-containing protein [Malacoplasma iowae]WPL39931.1 DnaJ domain-containing protein [Malacoplasma iowae]
MVFIIIFLILLGLGVGVFLFYYLNRKITSKEEGGKFQLKFLITLKKNFEKWIPLKKNKKTYNSVDIDNFLVNEILVPTQDSKIHHEINLLINENYQNGPNELSSKLIEWSNNNLIDFSALFTILNLYKNKFTYNIELWITSFVFFQILKEIKISNSNYKFESFKYFGVKRMDYKSYDNSPKYANALYFYNEKHFMYFGCFDARDSKMNLVINVIKNLNVSFVPQIMKKLKFLSNPLVAFFNKKIDINNIYNYISDTIYNAVLAEINKYYTYIYDNYNNRFKNQTFNNNHQQKNSNSQTNNYNQENKQQEQKTKSNDEEFKKTSLNNLKHMTFEESASILNISSKNPTIDEIKNAYKKMAKKYHPDIYKEQDSNEKMAIINKAYETLKSSFE